MSLPSLTGPMAEGTTLRPSDAEGLDLTETVAHVLRRWHDDTSGHPGPYPTCQEQPCNAVVQLLGPDGDPDYGTSSWEEL